MSEVFQEIMPDGPLYIDFVGPARPRGGGTVVAAASAVTGSDGHTTTATEPQAMEAGLSGAHVLPFS